MKEKPTLIVWALRLTTTMCLMVVSYYAPRIIRALEISVIQDAAIEVLKNDLDKVQNEGSIAMRIKVGKIESDINTLHTQIAEIRTSQAAMNGSLRTIENTVNSIKVEVDRINKKE